MSSPCFVGSVSAMMFVLSTIAATLVMMMSCFYYPFQATAFQLPIKPFSTTRPATEKSYTRWPLFSSSSDYLSALGDDLKYADPLKRFPDNRRRTRPTSNLALVASASSLNVTLYHASRKDLAIDQLASKGPRAHADVGSPHDSSKSLIRDVSTSISGNTLAAGSWWCAQGGWPSKKLRTTTEVFYVFDGFGCLTDLDGKRNYFGPGDTVILPKGWSGRWDIAEPIHKVWFVHDHDRIEEDTSSTIRARIIHYPDLVSPHTMDTTLTTRQDALHGSTPRSAAKTLYDIGPTNVGSWTCTAGSFAVNSPKPTTECFHVLEGTFFLTNNADGTTQRCVAGDTIVLPRGWTGMWDIIEPVKNLWVDA